MENILIKSLTFIIIIIIGYTLKQKKILKKEDSNTIATIVMNVTLPCALLTSANGLTITSTIIILIILGLLSNVVMIIIGYISSKKYDRLTRGVFMLNVSGFNIGNFALPFVQAFYSGLGVIYLCAFDIGNALMGLGLTYTAASQVASGTSQIKIKEILKKLFSSIPFDTYIVIFILGLLKLEVPSPIMSIASTIGAGNSFLAMLMIGLMLEIKLPKHEKNKIIQILILRTIGMIVLSLVTYFVLPLPMLAKQILVISYCAPLSTVSAVFARKLGYSGDAPAAANSLSIILAIVYMIVLLLIFNV